MSDINANIGVNIDTSNALAQLKALQREISNFHQSIVRTTAASVAAQRNLESNLLSSINATGKFTAQMGIIKSSTESFTHALETNKLSMREYFRFAAGSTQSFGKLFKTEFDTIGKVAEERVKTLQTQYIKMGRDASGAIRAMAIRPTTLNLEDYTTKAMVAAQKQAILNQLLKQGSTNLLNFGKNTQWAGRQLMVGFTVPLTMFGTQAAKVFMDLEMAAISFKRVYGDMFTSGDETKKALQDVQGIAKAFTQYGVAAADTVKTAASIAAMGKTGAALTEQLTSAVKLSVLGQIEQQQALETTISLTNAFGIAADQLNNKINFLNAVENQTVLSLDDITQAIPRVAPVVNQLGGSVEDLAFFMAAMKEGGISAAQGANALKSSLSAMINPTKSAVKLLADFGINVQGIVSANQGNLRATVVGLAQALDKLQPLQRQQAIEKLFGRYQFSRISALLSNITKEGSQANKVLQLTQSSVEELAILSQREMNTVKDAVTTQYKGALEQFRLSIAPIGKEFLKVVTPIIKGLSNIFDKFNNLSDGTKKFISQFVLLGGIIGPAALMTFGLFANALANIIKLFTVLRGGFKNLGSNTETLGLQTKYLKTEQLEAATVAASLNQAHVRLRQEFGLETTQLQALTTAYRQANAAAKTFTIANPGMVRPKVGGKYATGTTGLAGPAGAGDIIPIMASPGEAIIPAKTAQDPANKPLIAALVGGKKITGFETGTTKVEFGGQYFTAKSQKSAIEVDKFLKSLIYDESSNTYTYRDPSGKYPSRSFSKQTIIDALIKRQEQNNIPKKGLNLTTLQRALVVGPSGHRGAGAGTSKTSDPEQEEVIKSMKPKYAPEVDHIKKVLASEGYAVTKDQLDNLFGVQKSHVQKDIDPVTGAKLWKNPNLVPDLGYVNNYINDISRGLGKQLLLMTDVELAGLGIDRKILEKLIDGKHPTTAAEAETVRGIAKYDLSKTNKYTARAVLAGLDYRSQTGYYRSPLETFETAVQKLRVQKEQELEKRLVEKASRPGMPVKKAQIVGVQLGEYIKYADGTLEKLTSTNTEKMPRHLKTDNPTDKRVVALPEGATVVKSKSKQTPKTVKSVFKPRLIPGHADAPYLVGDSSSLPYDYEKSAQKIRKRFEGVADGAAKTEKALKELNDRTIKLATQAQENATQQGKTKRSMSEVATKAGNVANGLSAVAVVASFTNGTLGKVANAALPFIFGLQAMTTLFPMMKSGFGKLPPSIGKFAGPLASIAVIATTFAVTLKALNMVADNARAKMIDLNEQTGTTSENLKTLSTFAGTVSATEALRYRREQEKKPLGIAPGKTTFGEAYVKSDEGKSFVSGLKESLKSGGAQQAIADLQRQLATAVSSGVLTKDRAKSIALEMGTALGNQAIGLNVSAKLDKLFGPNGENLLDPNKSINIKVKLISEASDKTNTLLKQGPSYTGLNKIGGYVLNRSGTTGSVAAGVGTGAAIGAGLGTIIPGVGTAVGAAAGAVAGGVISWFSMKKAAEQTANWSAAVVGSQKQSLNVLEEMTASTKLRYESERAIAKAAGDTAKVRKLDKQYASDIKKLEEERLKIGQSILTTYDNQGKGAREQLLKSAKETAKRVNKDNPMYGFAQDQLGKAGGKAEYVLTVAMASGSLTPDQIVAIMDTFGKDKKKLETYINLLPKLGDDGMSQAANIMSAFIDKNGKINDKAQGEFLLALKKAPTGKDAEELMDFYNVITRNAGILDVGVMVNYFLTNPAAKKTLDGYLKKIQENDGKLNLKVLTDIMPANYINDEDKKYFESLDQNQRKVYLQEVATIMSIQTETDLKKDPEFEKWLNDSGKEGGSSYKGKSFPVQRAAWAAAVGERVTVAGTTTAVAPATNNSQSSGGGTKSDPYAFLQGAAQSVKNFRNNAIDAVKPLEALKQILSGKIKLDTFNGLAQKLAAIKSTKLKGGSGSGMSEGFMEALLGLDPKSFKELNGKLYTIEKGIIKLTPKGRAANKLFDMAALGESMGAMQKATRQTTNQVTAYDKLRKSGLDSATAMKIAGDAALASAIAGGRIKMSSKEWQKYKKAIDEATEANKKFATRNLIDRLNQEVEAAKNKKTAIDKLTAAGISLARAEEVAADEAAAFAIANESIDSANWPELLRLIKETGSAIGGATGKLDEFIKKLNADTKFKQELGAIIPDLKKMGLTTEEIQDILNDPELGQEIINAMKNGGAEAEKLRQYIEAAVKNREMNLKINVVMDAKQALSNQMSEMLSNINSVISAIDAKIQTIRNKYKKAIADAEANIAAAQANIDSINSRYEGLIAGIESQIAAKQEYIKRMFDKPIQAFQDQIAALQKQMEDLIDKPIEALNEKINELQRQIELTIDRPIAALNEKINELQREIEINYSRPLQALSEESDILSNNLTILGKQEEEINKKYDKQIAALEEVNKLNERISNEKKSQLTIADALSKGDISAAAKAIQDFRAEQAAAQAGSMTDALNAARQKEISGLTVGGMTKAQIEQRQYEIQQQQFKLQQQQLIIEKQIRDYQDQIYQLELQRKPLQDQILQYQDQIFEIEKGRKAIQDQIKAIEDQIAELEKQKKVVLEEIEGLEDQINELKKQQNAELAIANQKLKDAEDALKRITKEMEDEIKPLQDQRDEWEKIKDNLILAQAELEKWSGSIDDAKTAVDELSGAVGSVGDTADAVASQLAAMAAAAEAAAMAVEAAAAAAAAAASAISSINMSGMGGFNSGPLFDDGGLKGSYDSWSNFFFGGGGGDGSQVALSSGGVVPQYLADGGIGGIFKKRGTDTVPAMLTPGEYVINRGATKKFRPILDKINKDNFNTGQEFGRAHNTEGKHLGWDNSDLEKWPKIIDEPKTGGPLPPADGNTNYDSGKTGSTRGGEARSWDAGGGGPLSALNTPWSGVTSGGSTGGSTGGLTGGGTGSGTGDGGTGGGSGLSSAEIQQQIVLQKQLLEIEKQLLQIEKQRQTVMTVIATLNQQITTAIAMQEQMLKRVEVIYTKTPELLKKIIEQLNIQRDLSKELLELLTKQYQFFDEIWKTLIKQNIQNKIHKEFLQYFLDKTTGYPKIFEWVEKIWLKLKDGVNFELDRTKKFFEEIIEKNEQLYRDIEDRLVPAIDKANQALQRVSGTMDKIAASAKAALDAILALNTTVTTVHIIQEICIPCGANGASGSATGGLVMAAKGGIIPRYFAGGGFNSITFKPVGTDTVPAMLTPGEFVINAQSTQKFKPILQAINSGVMPNVTSSNASRPTPTTSRFNVSVPSAKRLSAPTYSKSSLPTSAGSGMNVAVTKMPTTISDNSAVYNYSVSVNVSGSEAGNPNDIANAVMQRIRQAEAQQIKSQVYR